MPSSLEKTAENAYKDEDYGTNTKLDSAAVRPNVNLRDMLNDGTVWTMSFNHLPNTLPSVLQLPAFDQPGTHDWRLIDPPATPRQPTPHQPATAVSHPGHQNTSKLEPASWLAPLMLMAFFAADAIRRRPDDPGVIVWIARRCWPCPDLLKHLLTWSDADGITVPWWQRCVWVDPACSAAGQSPLPGPSPPHVCAGASLADDPARRWWAIEQALRCPHVTVVVADASGADLTISRRWQLAAEAAGTVGLLARAPCELTPSAALARWTVQPVLCLDDGAGARPVWDLLRTHVKGSMPTGPDRWRVAWFDEVTDATPALRLAHTLGDQPSAAGLSAGQPQDALRHTTLTDLNAAERRAWGQAG